MVIIKKINTSNPNYLLLVSISLLLLGTIVMLLGTLGGVIAGTLNLISLVLGLYGLFRSVEIWFWKNSEFNKTANKILNVVLVFLFALMWLF